MDPVLIFEFEEVTGWTPIIWTKDKQGTLEVRRTQYKHNIETTANTKYFHLHDSCNQTNTPLKERLDEFVGAGKGAICGQKDPPVVFFLTWGIQEVRYQTVQICGFQPAHFTCPVLNESLCGLGRLLNRLSAQGYPKNRPVFVLLTPLLNRFLGQTLFICIIFTLSGCNGNLEM